MIEALFIDLLDEVNPPTKVLLRDEVILFNEFADVVDPQDLALMLTMLLFVLAEAVGTEFLNSGEVDLDPPAAHW